MTKVTPPGAPDAVYDGVGATGDCAETVVAGGAGSCAGGGCAAGGEEEDAAAAGAVCACPRKC